MFVPNFAILGVVHVLPEKSLTKNFMREKKKTNEGNDKHEDADPVLHNTTTHN